MGIDKGNNNASILYYDSVFGVHYPGISGQEGGGNEVHLLYEVQGTPSIVVIMPDHQIVYKQIYPPTQNNVTDSIFTAGGIMQPCMTAIGELSLDEIMTISPNPASGLVNIRLQIPSEMNLTATIRDLPGMTVWKSNPSFYTPGIHDISVVLRDITAGIYYVSLTENERVIAAKKLIVIQ